MGTRALITGGSGYRGYLLRDRLLEPGAAHVRVLDLVDVEDQPRDVEYQRRESKL